jgi:hypothetical protein
MSRKQSTPRQLHLLKEVKRKAAAEQEERLQLALTRLAQQGSGSSEAKPQPHPRTPPELSVDKYYAVRRGRVNVYILVGSSAKPKYTSTRGQSTSPSLSTNRLQLTFKPVAISSSQHLSDQVYY